MSMNDRNLNSQLNMIMWGFLLPGAHQKPNISALKEAVNDLCHMVMQKTAGQGKYAQKGNISFDNLERIKFTIICEAVALVLSGKLDEWQIKDGGNRCDKNRENEHWQTRGVGRSPGYKGDDERNSRDGGVGRYNA